MRVLFISSRDVYAVSNGGELCTNRNYLSFCSIVGERNVTVLNLMSGRSSGFFYPFYKRYNYFFGYNEGLSKKRLNEILKLSSEYEIVFIDTSLYGVIAEYLKKKKYKGRIICFFHNIETKIKWQRAKISPRRFVEYLLAYFNEKKAIRYSDRIVVLNKRDLAELQRKYSVHHVTIIPISLKDKIFKPSKGYINKVPTCIFTGNNWYANIHGLRWFVDKVLDYVNIKLIITGAGMERYRNMFKHPKIDLLGYVENFEKVISEADYVLIPIFYGSGMKVKTCEALRYGKNIIGTREAFEGYEVDYTKVGALCNTREEFIKEINRLSSENRKKFNEYSRNIFVCYYSFEATLEKFRLLIQDNISDSAFLEKEKNETSNCV